MNTERLSWLLAAAPVALIGIVGCAAEPYVSVADWRLRTLDARSYVIHAPQDLDAILPKHPTTYFLEADVRLPEALRHRTLTLTWETNAFATLLVDGERLLPLSVAPLDRFRPSHRELIFRIAETKTSRATLHLELDVNHVDVWTMSTGFAPRLAAAPYGERQLRVVRYVDETLLAGVATIFSLLALAAAVSFLLDRRRAADAWFAVMLLGNTVWHLIGLGITQLVDSRDIVRIALWTTPLSCAAAIRFTHAYFQLRPARVMPLIVVTIGLIALILGWKPFASYSRETALIELQTVLSMLYQLIALARLAWDRARRLDALCMLAAWALVGTTGLMQARALPLVDYMPFAWLVFVVTQAVLLLRQHARELRALNVELEDRVVIVEERNREVSRLNDELRCQIHDRSARLADALGRIGRLSDNKVAALTVGTLIGDRYKVIRALGQGGMSAVYEAERTTDGSRFALKILVRAGSGAWLARLAREAHAATAVVHRNVVKVVDIDVDASGTPFIVMELVQGAPLTAQKTRFGDASFAREVVRQIAAGLSALHEAGIVHRDLKPANVLLEPQPFGCFCVKIVDFGIARVSPAPVPLGGVLDTNRFIPFVRDATIGATAAMTGAEGGVCAGGALTRTGSLLGTPMYMAPELAHGVKDAEPSSDLWSLGVVAYQLSCGKLPFVEPAVIWAGDGGTKPRVDMERLSAPLRDLVERCLEVDPGRRPTAAEVVAALA
jgi:serine/threonine-protein kinase